MRNFLEQYLIYSSSNSGDSKDGDGVKEVVAINDSHH